MDYHQIYLELGRQLPDFNIQENHPLAPYTTLRIGGPADIFVHTKNSFQLKTILKFIFDHNIPDYTILGNGSNVLISDQGLRGIIIKNSSQKIDILGNSGHQASTPASTISAHRTENEPDKYLDFTKIDYDESGSPAVLVKFSSGTPLPYAINYLIGQGVTGLQWFAYIPGTVGGAVWYNIHGGKYHFSDYLHKITTFNLKTGQTENFRKQDLKWDYDQSFFQKNPHYVILNVTLKLYKGDAVRAKTTADAWIAQKIKVQPMNSAGSVFKNPKLEDCLNNWGEQKSTGWIIDHELGWKGRFHGGAQISEKHANFITNANHATASDYYELAKSVQDEIKKRFGLDLEMEVKLLGRF